MADHSYSRGQIGDSHHILFERPIILTLRSVRQEQRVQFLLSLIDLLEQDWIH